MASGMATTYGAGGALRGLVPRGDDRRDERGNGSLVAVVHDLRARLAEVDLDRGDAGNLSQRRVDVFDTPVARHAGDPQGGDHEATVA